MNSVRNREETRVWILSPCSNLSFPAGITTSSGITELAKATDYCGVKSGRDVNKIKDTGLTFEPAKEVSCPMITESPVNLECKVIEVKEYPTHDMFIAEIVRVHADEALYDKTDRIRLDRAGLLAYNHGEYFGLKKQPIGKFGYSIMKAKTKKRINREKARHSRSAGKKRKK